MSDRAWHPHTQAPQTPAEYSRFACIGLLAACALLIPAYAHAVDTIAETDPDEIPTESTDTTTEPAQWSEPTVTEAPTARPPELKTSVPLRYVVKKGDTLWDIADYFLKEPWKWPELWYGNPQIRNPHLIYPGDVLLLTYVDGRPRLTLEAPSDVEKLSPRVREELLRDPIPVIPGDAINAFLRGPRVVGADELEAAPYIIEFAQEHLIGGAGIPAYAKGIKRGELPNHVIVRKGQVYRDPDTREVLGYEALYVGTSSVRTPGDPARLNVDTSAREVLIGDRLLPQDESDLLASAYFPHVAITRIEGQIIAVTDAVSQIAQYQIVTLNRGARDGVEVGQVFTIYQAGRQVRDPYGSARASITLPEEDAGLLLVFKTYEKVSHGLVMKATRSIHLLDKIRTPGR